MLKIIHKGNSMAASWPVDPSCSFQPGMIGQLKTLGNNTVCGVSDGTAPLGIIDDIKTNAFTAPSIDEVLIVSVPNPIMSGGKLVTPVDIKQELGNPNVFEYSFMSSVSVALVSSKGMSRNGLIIIPAGTELNFDMAGSGTPDSVRLVVNYIYQVPNIPGDDSTAGSGHVTIWFQRMIFQTDQFETNQHYALNSPLFVSESGLLTTRQIDPRIPSIAIVTGSPSPIFSTLEAIWM